MCDPTENNELKEGENDDQEERIHQERPIPPPDDHPYSTKYFTDQYGIAREKSRAASGALEASLTTDQQRLLMSLDNSEPLDSYAEAISILGENQLNWPVDNGSSSLFRSDFVRGPQQADQSVFSYGRAVETSNREQPPILEGFSRNYPNAVFVTREAASPAPPPGPPNPPPQLVRGSSAGRTTREPDSPSAKEGFKYSRCELTLINAEEESICGSSWSPREKIEMRRIVRIQRKQEGSAVIAEFEVVPINSPIEEDGKNFIEISCLQCLCLRKYPSYDDEHIVCRFENEEILLDRSYYTTSVEVVKVVKFLANLPEMNKREERKENGRIRSNLSAFWSERPINSKKMVMRMKEGRTNADFKEELGRRIMDYTSRRPRGFDRDVRILEWRNLGSALKRAMRSYYAEVKQE
ncbi:DEKNAAC105248 [Brettanomyces naardenensis]|uniref:DEKNAAC105248 n=1 Tax=Brettanomyces naardenensis TaxID=13370 RepID=A0A448YSV4_BRENA|nr:DEKNAAC105248 [Brettanomyces naardenensis]